MGTKLVVQIGDSYEGTNIGGLREYGRLTCKHNRVDMGKVGLNMSRKKKVTNM